MSLLTRATRGGGIRFSVADPRPSAAEARIRSHKSYVDVEHLEHTEKRYWITKVDTIAGPADTELVEVARSSITDNVIEHLGVSTPDRPVVVTIVGSYAIRLRRCEQHEMAAARERQRHARRVEAAHRAEQEADRQRASATPVTYGEVNRIADLTVAKAAAVIEEAHGNLRIDSGRLVVSLPPRSMNEPTSRVRAAVLTLHAAEAVVVACLDKKRPSTLPDNYVGPNGAIIK